MKCRFSPSKTSSPPVTKLGKVVLHSHSVHFGEPVPGEMFIIGHHLIKIIHLYLMYY